MYVAKKWHDDIYAVVSTSSTNNQNLRWPKVAHFFSKWLHYRFVLFHGFLDL